ncbi:MAG: 30S ribosomal protein S12 methylthiotransferase RimO, partial [Helicobacter sp.]|nr:30S ribosomal protein S12 methylthiotransferase RimO [Helicobacter sp.]
SANLEQIPQKTINSRLKEVNKIFSKSYKESLKNLVGKEIVAIVEGRSQESEFFYSARDMRFAPEIDGEILINDSLCGDLRSGYYVVKISEVVGENVLGCAVRAI